MSTAGKPRDDSGVPASHMNRRRFLHSATAMGVTVALGHRVGAQDVASPGQLLGQPPEPSSFELPEQSSFQLNEITISALQRGMAERRYTARSVVKLYLGRIDALDRAGPKLRSVIEVNPDALAAADALDAERKAGKVRGPLHGVPVLLKDVVDTADRMHTTAGSFALMGSFAARDAFIAERLRAAGAVLLGKTNLSEWSNARSTHATSGWSARGGLTKNAYVLDRTACGSSSGSGVAVAANLGAIGVGAETDGSIACPASANSLVGIKPTVGLWSRSGLIPVTYSFDSPGPLARTVTDAAILLGALTGVDPRDAATSESHGHALTDYTTALDKGALKGARIGVLRRDLTERSAVSGVFAESLKAMQSAGAILIDDVDLPTFEDLQIPKAIVLLCELKDSMRDYLRQRANEPHTSLGDLIRFNEQNADVEMKWFGQEFFETAEGTRGRETRDYQPALARCQTLTRTLGLDRALGERQLDAIVSLAANVPFTTDLLTGDHPIVRNSFLSAVAGYPRVTVPAGFVRGLPVGISFMGAAWSEPRLIGLAYAFEQMVQARQVPRFIPSAVLDDET
jgi:amidase